MRSVRVRPEAEADIAAAAGWYEQQGNALGTEFILCLDACMQAIQAHPDVYAQIHRAIRRALVRRFPYAVFFIVEQHAIVVLAIFHVRRNPRTWQDRIK